MLKQKLSFFKLQIICFLLACLCLTNVSYAHSDEYQQIKNFGDHARYAIPFTAGLFTVYHQDLDGFKQFAISLLAVQATTEGLKSVVREKRPNGHSNLSFPSGHVSAAFSGAAFVHRRYGVIPSIPLYLAASAVAGSRVYVKAHYVHDVVAGAALGVGITWLLSKPLEDESIQIIPIVSEKSAGIHIQKQFN